MQALRQEINLALPNVFLASTLSRMKVADTAKPKVFSLINVHQEAGIFLGYFQRGEGQLKGML